MPCAKTRASAVAPPRVVSPVQVAAAAVESDQMSTSASTSGRDLLFYGFSSFVREITSSSRTAAHDLGTDLTTFPAFCSSVSDGSAVFVDLLTSFASSIPGPEWKLMLEERFKTFLSAIEAVVESTETIPVRFLLFIRFTGSFEFCSGWFDFTLNDALLCLVHFKFRDLINCFCFSSGIQAFLDSMFLILSFSVCRSTSCRRTVLHAPIGSSKASPRPCRS